MMPVLARKATRDLAVDPTRSLLAALVVAAGAFGVTTVLDAYATLSRDLAAGFRATQPAAAVLWTDDASDSEVARVRAVPGVAAAEARPAVAARVRVGGRWVPAMFFRVRDFDRIAIDRLERVAGAWPRAGGEVALERTAMGLAGARVGGALAARLEGGRTVPLHITGAGHAGGLPPAWMDHVITGFAPWESDLGPGAPAIRLTVADSALDAAHVARVAHSAAAALAATGHRVTRIDVPPPGRHPHADQMETFLFLLGAFAALALALGALLVSGLVEAWLARQTREIGILKALGATDAQVGRLLVSEVAALAALGTGLGISAGRAAGRAYALFSADMLNLPLSRAGAPIWALAVELALGVGVPLAASALALRRTARLGVRDALDAEEGGREAAAARPLDPALARLARGPVALVHALRSALRRPGRLARTGLALAVGGALFVAASSVQEAWTKALATERAARRYDLDLRLVRPAATATVARALAGAPGVAAWSACAETLADLAWPGAPPDTRVVVSATVAGTPLAGHARLLDLPLVRGHAPAAGDAAAALVNEALLARCPGLAVGQALPLVTGGRATALRVVGVVRELSPQPTVYAAAAWVARAQGPDGPRVRALRVAAAPGVSPAALADGLEAGLARAGAEVALASSVDERLRALADHLVIVRSALLLATALVLLVGLLGVATWLGTGVLERRREIGVLAALGAGPGALFARFVCEGLVVSAVAWPVALPLAGPIAWALEAITGQLFFHAPLPLAYSAGAALAWLPLSAVLAVAGSATPALRAARVPVQEALRHA